MQSTDDSALLRRYAENNSDAAFAALVTRHINLVYSVALRQVANPHHAEEITQAVFIILARKAASLRHDRALSSWLFQATRLTAGNFIRSEIRRHRREEEAYMQSVLNETGTDVWPKIAPLLDDAVAGLREQDRQAIVLRFYEGRNLREVGLALGASEAAAEKRVNRAVEKLRKFFTKRGVTLSSVAITGAISANSVQAAPVGLAKSVTAVAIAKGAAASGSTLTLIKGALKIMAWTKMKTAIVVGVVIILTGGTTTVVVEKILENRSPVIAESFWKKDARTLQKAPPVLIIRPTHFPGNGGGVGTENDRLIQLDASIKTLVSVAFSFDWTQILMPEDLPKEHYDLMLTLPDDPNEKLKMEITKKFGIVAHFETRETEVLLLEVGSASELKFKAGSNFRTSSITSEAGQVVIHNLGISSLVPYLEGVLNKPVFDRTELKDVYDFQLKYPPSTGEPEEDTVKRAVREQLGLELVPTNMPIKMLVVEKVK